MSIYITQELPQDEQRRTIYYFCSGQQEQRNSATAVLRGLIWQLTYLCPKLTTQLVPLFDPPERGRATLESEETLWNLFTTLAGQVTNKLYCLIDGMDECDEDSTYWLASKLLELKGDHEAGDIRVVILSRDIPAFGTDITHIELDPDYRANISADVELFVRNRLQPLFQQLSLSFDFRDAVVHTLLAKPEGTFLGVGFVIAELSQKKTRTQIERALYRLPKGLPAFYATMLYRIEPVNRHNSIQLLTWLALSFKPLSLKTFADILECRGTASIGEEEATLDEIAVCAPIITVQAEEIGFVHLSARDYLLRPDNDPDPLLESFRVVPEAAHLLIARRCLKSLERGSWLQYYALTNWPKHAERCVTKHLIELEESFFAELSCTRDSWWHKFSMNFRGLPQTSPSRLHIACFLGLKSWVQIILTQRSDQSASPEEVLLNAQCSIGWLPLDYAADGGNVEVAKFLLEATPDSTLMLEANEAVLRRAVLAERSAAVRLLLAQGLNSSSRDTQGTSLLHHAVRLGNKTIVELLLGYGADLCATDAQKLLPLHEACLSGHETLAKSLLEAGADVRDAVVDAKDKHGRTAMHILLAKGVPDGRCERSTISTASKLRQQCLRLLLDYGADPDTQNGDGDSALHVACSKGILSAVALLIDRRANEELLNANQQTPREIAEFEGYRRIAEYLDDWGAKGSRISTSHPGILEFEIDEGLALDAYPMRRVQKPQRKG